MRWVLEHLGFAGFVAVKAVVAALVTAALIYWPHWATLIMAGTFAALTFKVALHNIRCIKKLKRNG